MRLPVPLKPSPVGKVAPQGRMRGRFAAAIRLQATEARFPLISQRAGPLTASPEGEAIVQKNAAPFSGNSVSIYYTKVSATSTASSRRISLRRFCRSARRSVGEVNTIPSSGGAAGSVNCKLMPGPSPTVNAQPMALV